jgi:hypothetical protein
VNAIWRLKAEICSFEEQTRLFGMTAKDNRFGRMASGVLFDEQAFDEISNEY